jgi:hypothetical protein
MLEIKIKHNQSSHQTETRSADFWQVLLVLEKKIKGKIKNEYQI